MEGMPYERTKIEKEKKRELEKLVLRTISPKIVEVEKENKEPPNGEIEERTVMVDLEAQEECLLEARIAAWLESLLI